MPPKAKLQAPIDRPLSRAYLREFGGWSTAYPPGISDPTTLRLMENILINRDGSAQVRPGLRYLSYGALPQEATPGTKAPEQVVGTHEAFYLNDGTKAYLFAVRESDGTVGFRALAVRTTGSTVHALDDPLIGFDIPQGAAALCFTEATTYVKYVQIDNKIFALSNAGETMRLFTVGAIKTAKRLGPITRPDWEISDKLTVVHPEAVWIQDGSVDSVRRNLIANPSFEGGPGSTATATYEIVSSPAPISGSKAIKIGSAPAKKNLIRSPLHNVALYGVAGWSSGTNSTVSDFSDSMQVMITSASNNSGNGSAKGSQFPVVPGQSLQVGFDLTALVGVSQMHFSLLYYSAGGVHLATGFSSAYTSTSGRKVDVISSAAPSGAAYAVPYFSGKATANGGYFAVRNVTVGPGAFAPLNGDMVGDYYWNGPVNDSESVYHPPADPSLIPAFITPLEYASPGPSVASIYVRAESQSRSVSLVYGFLDSSYNALATYTGAATSVTGAWTRVWAAGDIPPGAAYVTVAAQMTAVEHGEFHFFDAAMLEPGLNTPDTYFDGSTPTTSEAVYSWTGTPHASSSVRLSLEDAGILPDPETPTADTLISSTSSKNTYSFGFFYTFSNEVGESAASQITLRRVQRPWSAWRMETANSAGEPSGGRTDDPAFAADQLVAILPEDVFTAALAQGATEWHLYAFSWSDQDAVPVQALRVGSRKLTPESSHANFGWLRVTAASPAGATDSAPIPNLNNRYNYSQPGGAGQGLVASDRMILVNDPTAAAVIRWSSNNQGDYSNFTAAKGGGYKTLTSGNLFIPACVKLWQNPQSVDTLTVLCMGTDGHSTSYYMAPAVVSSQSEQVAVMGFEETTATPGTTSPYGCEVFNNALYHPLDEQLMKSTANNYNISHKSMTDQIRDGWERLASKHKIVSSVLDGRLYYVVHNPLGAALEPGCNGNELWVFDAVAEGGTWSRFMVQALSLRKIEFGGQLYMSVIRPDGIFFLDPAYGRDDYVASDGSILSRPIPWRLETNTQGANRAHDAWAHLRQVSLTMGNFKGRLRWGVRGRDLHGKDVLVEKVTRHDEPAVGEVVDDGTLFDVEDHLRVARDMKEWFFFASSLDGEESSGQLDLVQYRYAPVSVNVGYEYGSVETFEYGRDYALASASTTVNGVPVPMIDTTRP